MAGAGASDKKAKKRDYGNYMYATMARCRIHTAKTSFRPYYDYDDYTSYPPSAGEAEKHGMAEGVDWQRNGADAKDGLELQEHQGSEHDKRHEMKGAPCPSDSSLRACIEAAQGEDSTAAEEVKAGGEEAGNEMAYV